MNVTAFVYILTTANNTTLYVGVTTDLRSRMYEHKTKQNPYSFTSRYNIHKLVYFECFETISEAINREKELKGKGRLWKVALITSKNPNWVHLIIPA